MLALLFYHIGGTSVGAGGGEGTTLVVAMQPKLKLPLPVHQEKNLEPSARAVLAKTGLKRDSG